MDFEVHFLDFLKMVFHTDKMIDLGQIAIVLCNPELRVVIPSFVHLLETFLPVHLDFRRRSYIVQSANDLPDHYSTRSSHCSSKKILEKHLISL